MPNSRQKFLPNIVKSNFIILWLSPSKTIYYIFLYYIISYHHIISYRIISYRIVSYHIVSYRIVSFIILFIILQRVALIEHYTCCYKYAHTNTHMHACTYTRFCFNMLINQVHELTHDFCPNTFIFQLLSGHVQETHRFRPHHTTIPHTETRTSQRHTYTI